MQTRDVVLAFVDRINHHDVAGLVALMAGDHRFVDGLGQEVRGRERMGQGWRSYFNWFPDYSIKVEETLTNRDVVAVFGTAQGTYSQGGEFGSENHWSIPAAWKARVRNGRILEWQVYADNEPVWKIMGVKRY